MRPVDSCSGSARKSLIHSIQTTPVYAEAVALEQDEKLYLDTDELKAAHDVIVTGAKEDNELVDVLSDLKGEIWNLAGVKREERVSTADVRCKLGMLPGDALRSHDPGRRIAEAMMTLGWTKAPGTIRCHKGDQSTTGYTRPLPDGPQSSNTQPVDIGGEAAQAMNTTNGTGDITLDQGLAPDLAQAQADPALVLGND